MNQQNNRVVLGAIIIGFGLLALIDNLHLFGMVDIFTFWPTVFIVVGILKISQTRNRSGYIFGAALITLGVLFTLEHLGVFYFRMRDLWPLLLIGAGALILSKGWVDRGSGGSEGKGFLGIYFGPTQFSNADASYAQADANNTLNIAAIMSGNKVRKDTQDFRGGEVVAIMGSVEIDLRQASIQGEAVLNVLSIWGGIVLKVPADWSVVSNAVPVMGGIEDKTVPPAAPGKRLIIEGCALMGGVEIKN
jgi:predicted membrane protein